MVEFFKDVDIMKIVIEAVISIVTILIGRYLIPWFKSTLICKWAQEAVKAAEQLHGSGEGRIKKGEVLQFLETILKRYRISVTAEELDIYIESAVKKLKLEMAA